jgi:ABC-type sugar transport system ATPase subunit
LRAEGVASGERLRGIDIDIRAGEIIGIAGLVGSGRTRLCRVLSGAERPTAGVLKLNGHDIRFSGPQAAVAAGVVLIPEDRKYQALSLQSPLTSNLVLMALAKKLGRFGLVRRDSVRALSERLVTDLQVSPHNIDAIVGTLSGGNQQKVVLGKAIAADPDVLIIDQPTAGVDIGTKAQIHRLLRDKADAGAAILVVSDDLEELYALSDRFQVLRRGETIWKGTSDQVAYAELVELISTGAPSLAGTLNDVD